MSRRLCLAAFLVSVSLAPLTWYGPVLFGNEKAHHQTLARFLGVELQSSGYLTDQARAADGRLVSNKPPGFPVLMFPGYLLLQGLKAFALVQWTEDLEFSLLKIISLIFPGFVFYWMILIAMEQMKFQLGTSYWIAFTTIYATLLLPYSTLFVSHVPSAALVLCAFYFALKNYQTPSNRSAFIGALSAAFSFVIDYSNLFAVLPSLALLAWQSYRTRVIWPYFLGIGLPGLILVSYNLAIFGKITALSYSTVQPPAYVTWPGVPKSFANNPFPTFFAFLFSKSRGIFVLHPVLLAGLLGIWFSNRKGFPVAAQMALLTFLVSVFSLSFYLYWHGGNSVGSRHILVAIPFLCLFLGYVIEEGGWSRIVYAVLLFLSLITALLAYRIQIDDVAIHLTWLQEPRNIHGAFYGLLVPVALSGRKTAILFPFRLLLLYFLLIVPALHLAMYYLWMRKRPGLS